MTAIFKTSRHTNRRCEECASFEISTFGPFLAFESGACMDDSSDHYMHLVTSNHVGCDKLTEKGSE